MVHHLFMDFMLRNNYICNKLFNMAKQSFLSFEEDFQLLRKDMRKFKNDLILCMFVYYVSQTVITCMLLTLLKK